MRKAGALVMAFTNMEWADSDSLEVICGLLEERKKSCVMLIGTHRPVQSTSRLAHYKEKIMHEDFPVAVAPLRMRPLKEAELIQWLAVVLRRDGNDGDFLDFARSVHECCQGSPFFVTRFLHLLVCEEVLWQAGDSYDWDEDELESYVSEGLTVVDVMARALEHCSDDVQIVLRTAACLDTRYISPTLLFYSLTADSRFCVAQSVKQVTSILEKALADGILRRTVEQEYEFEHDLYRTTALRLLASPSEQRAIHLQIGRHLRELVETLSECRRDQGFRNRMLLLAASQVNLGLGDGNSKDENMVIQVELNYQAADVAMKRMNFCGAHAFLERARDGLGGSHSWKTHYDLTLRVFTALSRCLYCTGDFDDALVVADEIIERAKSVDDAADGGYDTRINCLNQQRRFDLSRQTCLEVLHKYKVNYFRKLVGIQIRTEEYRTRRLLANVQVEEIFKMRPVIDLTTLNLMKFTNRLIEVLIISKTSSSLMKIVRCRLLQLTIRHGFVDASCFALTCWEWASIDHYNLADAYRYGSLGMALAKRTESVAYRGRAGSTFHVDIAHWQKPVCESLAPVRAGLDDYWRHGLVENYFLEAFCAIILAFASGEILENQMTFTDRLFELGMDFHQERNHITHAPLYQMLANLSGRSRSGSELTGEFTEEKSHLASITAADNVTALHQFYWAKLVLGVTFDDMEVAVRASDALEIVVKEPRPMPALPFRLLYSGIAYFSLARKGQHKTEYSAAAGRALAALKKWIKSGAASYEHMHFLLLAESMSAKGESKESILEMYQRSILGAASQGMVHNEALANERSGRFLMRNGGHRQNIIVYLSKAKELYLKWGALPKVAQLDRTIQRVRDINSKELFEMPMASMTTNYSDITASIDTHNEA